MKRKEKAFRDDITLCASCCCSITTNGGTRVGDVFCHDNERAHVCVCCVCVVSVCVCVVVVVVVSRLNGGSSSSRSSSSSITAKRWDQSGRHFFAMRMNVCVCVCFWSVAFADSRQSSLNRRRVGAVPPCRHVSELNMDLTKAVVLRCVQQHAVADAYTSI